MVAVCIEGGGEGTHGGVLVELIGRVCRYFLPLGGCGSVAYVVVGVFVGCFVDCGTGEFAAGVVGEGVVYHFVLAGGVAGEWAAEGVVGVGALCYEDVAAVVAHLGEQVALRFVVLGECHAVGHGEFL